MAKEIDEVIQENAEGPKSVASDGTSVSNHSLKDQIEADRYLKSNAAASKGLGVRRTKMRPPPPI